LSLQLFRKYVSPCLFLIQILTGGPSAAQLVINEFLADPAGADGGREFVEFLNTGTSDFNLEGLQFQFANGSVGPQWETRWIFSGLELLGPGERFLLVDRNWLQPEAFDAQAWLGLQNGPDAIRIIQGGQTLDMVGYGPLSDPEMAEGDAVALPVGLSLMRKPDGHDTGNNAHDFFPGVPTAGTANYQPYGLDALVVELEPPSLVEAGTSVLIKVTLKNSGLQDIPPGQMQVLLVKENGEQAQVDDSFFSGCRAEDEKYIEQVVTPRESGRFRILLQVPVPEFLLAVQVATLQVGCGAAFISEVLARPSAHQGEWIEIQAGSEDVNLQNFRIRDEDGSWRDLPSVELAAHQFILVAQDSSALLNWRLDNLQSGLVLGCPEDQLSHVLRSMPSSWPSLNNSAPEGRDFSDRVYLADDQGVVDHVTLPGDEYPGDLDGHSWERSSHDPGSFLWSRWRVGVAPEGGTPGCENSVASLAGFSTGLEVQPAMLDSRLSSEVVHIRFRLEAGQRGWHLEIFDLWGAMVRDLGGAESGPGPGEVLWDGCDDGGRSLTSGGYVVLLLTSQEEGVFHPAQKRLVVIR